MKDKIIQAGMAAIGEQEGYEGLELGGWRLVSSRYHGFIAEVSLRRGENTFQVWVSCDLDTETCEAV